MAVVNCAITRYAHATHTVSEDGVWSLESSDYRKVYQSRGGLGNVADEDGIRLHKAVLRKLDIVRPCHLVSRCDVPSGGGLGSSAAVATSLIGALTLTEEGKLMSLEDMCTISHEIERTEMGINSGVQDQYGAVFGGFNYLSTKNGLVVRQEISPCPAFRCEFERLLLVIDTGTSHFSGE